MRPTKSPNDSLSRVDGAFYQRPTATVAKELIGQVICHRTDGVWVGGVIVETEAYLDCGDPASHSARGKTKSNASMFGHPGTMYVYPIHAKHCLNVVTEECERGAAVLIRAIEPVWGIEVMRQRRRLSEIRRLVSGPAMLCQALSIDRADDGRCFLTDSELGIFRSSEENSGKRRVRVTKRIGLSKAKHRNLRFVDPDSSFLSRRFRP